MQRHLYPILVITSSVAAKAVLQSPSLLQRSLADEMTNQSPGLSNEAILTLIGVCVASVGIVITLSRPGCSHWL
jgi:hypothetical protein